MRNYLLFIIFLFLLLIFTKKKENREHWYGNFYPDILTITTKHKQPTCINKEKQPKKIDVKPVDKKPTFQKKIVNCDTRDKYAGDILKNTKTYECYKQDYIYKKIPDTPDIEFKIENIKYSDKLRNQFDNNDELSIEIYNLIDKLGENTYIVDCLSDTGYNTLMMSQLIKNRNIKVISIEPNNDKISFQKTIVNLNNIKNISFINSALGKNMKIGYLKKEQKGVSTWKNLSRKEMTQIFKYISETDDINLSEKYSLGKLGMKKYNIIFSMITSDKEYEKIVPICFPKFKLNNFAKNNDISKKYDFSLLPKNDCKACNEHEKK